MRGRPWVLAATLLLAACAHTASPPRPGPPVAVAPTSPSASPSPSNARPSGDVTVAAEAEIPLDALPGWEFEDHAGALMAYGQTCAVARDPAARAVCAEARAAGALDEARARAFLQAHFTARAYQGTGLLTGYFAPTYEIRAAADAEFSDPVRPRPADLRGAAPYADRAAIEARPARDALGWMRPEDLFFLQIQGSGLLTYPGGRKVRAVYAASNNQPFVAIARPMREQGLLAADNTSGDAIRAWLAAHRGPAAQAVMNLNGRYIFFAFQPDDGAEAVGAAGVSLPVGRAVAVDPAFHTYGEALWLDAAAPILAGAFPAYRRLAMALDTGSAIRGEVRADLYMGTGDAAGAEAGRVRHDLTLYRLVPRP
ncbi:MAG: transglycosylase [Caulobacteraceae bacterium]|nr:transglycosylase [Caulobacteraceae bacterium]